MTLPHDIVLGNTILAWIIALGLTLSVLCGLFLFKHFGLRKFARFAEHTQTIWDDLIVAVLKKTNLYTYLSISLYAGVQALDLHPRLLQAGRVGFIVVLLAQGTIWASTAVEFILARNLERRAANDEGGTTALKALGVAFKVTLWSVFLLLALSAFGMNVTGLVAGLGIGGIAIALALQKILGDLFASLSIVLDRPFEVGDFIIVGSELGVVEQIGLKSTRIRSLSGEQLVISNNDLLSSRIQNFKRMRERRVLFSLGVTFQTEHQKLAAIPPMIRDIINAQDGVRFDRAHFQSIGDSALKFEVVYYLLDPDYNRYMDVQQAINLEIMARFEAAGIAFAYPTRTLFLEGPFTAPETPSR